MVRCNCKRYYFVDASVWTGVLKIGSDWSVWSIKPQIKSCRASIQWIIQKTNWTDRTEFFFFKKNKTVIIKKLKIKLCFFKISESIAENNYALTERNGKNDPRHCIALCGKRQVKILKKFFLPHCIILCGDWEILLLFS